MEGFEAGEFYFRDRDIKIAVNFVNLDDGVTQRSPCCVNPMASLACSKT